MVSNSNSGTNGGKQYFSIMFGKFSTKSNQDNPDAISRENKKQETVWELRYDTISGKVDKVELQDSDYGQVVVITFNDNTVLNLNRTSSLVGKFLMMLLSIDKNKPVSFSLFETEYNGKKKTALSTKQDSKPVKNKFWNNDTKSYDKLPALEKVVIKGQTQWDDTKLFDFLMLAVSNTYVEKIEPVSPPPTSENEGDNDECPY